MQFVITNGKVVAEREANLCDFMGENPFIISQNVWFGFGGIPLLHENLLSLEHQFQSFNSSLPQLFTNKRELFRLTKRMLNKNKFYRSGHIFYQFYISGKKVHSFICSKAYATFDFPIAEKGIFLNFADERKYSTSDLYQLKCHNNLFWESAQRNANLKNDESLIFVNATNKLCEGLAANLFLIKDDVLATPSIHSGCYNDVLRSIVLNQAKALNLKVIESSELSVEHIAEMDEVFLASEGKGIQWVLGLNKKRFVNQTTKEIYRAINKYLEEKTM
jgi:branched-chain amino acid aminotransferase